jgi:hypothetical protein
MIGRASFCLSALALLGAGCERDDRPLDGGQPLEFEEMPGDAKIFAEQYCARREKGGWHRSVGHCEPMLSAQEMQGVVVTAFEELSYFPGRTTIPHPDDPSRYTQEIEFDTRRLEPFAAELPQGGFGDVYLLRFVGRRMRYPYLVDCQGTPHFVTVVDRLISIRPLGTMGAARPIDEEEERARPVTVRRRHAGRWGELEAEAVERCSGRGPGMDELERALSDDQMPAQASPPGNASAE